MISQPVFSIFPVLHCPLGLAELQACPLPDVVFQPLPLSALSSSPCHCAFARWFWPVMDSNRGQNSFSSLSLCVCVCVCVCASSLARVTGKESTNHSLCCCFFVLLLFCKWRLACAPQSHSFGPRISPQWLSESFKTSCV